MIYTVRINTKFDSIKFKDWDPWTGEFKSNKGHTEDTVINHIKKHFNGPEYKKYIFGLFCRDNEIRNSSWVFLKLLEL